jgi:hypothetical protein
MKRHLLAKVCGRRQWPLEVALVYKAVENVGDGSDTSTKPVESEKAAHNFEARPDVSAKNEQGCANR